MKHYYVETLPLVTEQVSAKQDLAASILEANALSYTAQQEWETEWNHMGLASRLTPKVVCRASIKHYRKTSNIRGTLVGNKIVDHSDVVGASPVGAAPTTSSFST